jgi:Rrf2 family iron-sulfur cluster assembly transcriptional regulator
MLRMHRKRQHWVAQTTIQVYSLGFFQKSVYYLTQKPPDWRGLFGVISLQPGHCPRLLRGSLWQDRGVLWGGIPLRLTTRATYSIRALLDLAMLGSGQMASVRAIAERQQIPAPYLEKLLIELRQAGLVRSQRGAQGGYQLARVPRRIPLSAILAAVGESLDPLAIADREDGSDTVTNTETNSSSVDKPGKGSVERLDWVTEALWDRIARRVQQVLEETTLEDLYFDARSWQAAQDQESGFVV